LEEYKKMTKKIFATVLAVCVLGTIIAGCSKSDDANAPAGTATATGGTATATK
jgi:hypothetical protein